MRGGLERRRATRTRSRRPALALQVTAANFRSVGVLLGCLRCLDELSRALAELQREIACRPFDLLPLLSSKGCKGEAWLHQGLSRARTGFGGGMRSE